MDSATTPITIRGPYLWRGEDRFLVRGVVYQEYYRTEEERFSADWDSIDPIADDRLIQLQHDISLLRELGVNKIFVYYIDSTKDHDQAMKLLQDAGIYVLALVSTNLDCINRSAPHQSYNADTMNSFFRTIDVLAQYPNTLGILAAHLLINNDQSLTCVPVVSAVVRDLKRYMRIQSQANGTRMLPVGYGACDPSERERAILHHLSSGDVEDRIDFWTCTYYRWRQTSETVEAAYNDLAVIYKGEGIPMFISEYGTPTSRPRTFDETTAIYSPQVLKVFSGSCVYEFWNGANRYGLVQMVHTSRDNLADRDQHLVHETLQSPWGDLIVLKDFENYKAKLRATRAVRPNTDWEAVDKEVPSAMMEQQRLRWSRVPDSCVNWDLI